MPDDYADRYLPEILARFSRSNPKAEVTVMCEPTQNLIERVQHGDVDLAIITHVDRRGPSEIVRIEALLWVTSARHAVHEEPPFPWRWADPIVTGHSATEALESADRPFRILYVAWHSTAVGAAVLAGLAVSVLPESAVRPGMRILGPSDGFPACPGARSADPGAPGGEPAGGRAGFSYQAISRQSRCDASLAGARRRMITASARACAAPERCR